MPITLTCEQCGKSYKTKPYMADKSNKHFCSSACYGEWQKINNIGRGRKRIAVKCFTCGIEFEKQSSAVSEHNFCSRACFSKWRKSPDWSGKNNPAWLGGNTNYRGENWNQQRQAARIRDNNACQHCGRTGDNLPVHHKKPFHLFDDYREANQLDNLITLCPACHSAADIQFWKDNPHLINGRKFPNVAPVKNCRKCSKEFQPRSPRTVVCDACCTTVCEYCGKVFYSRKAVHRKVKYCSRECRNNSIKLQPQTCLGCGKIFTPDRRGVKFCSQQCHLTNNNPRRKFFAKHSSAVQG